MFDTSSVYSIDVKLHKKEWACCELASVVKYVADAPNAMIAGRNPNLGSP